MHTKDEVMKMLKLEKEQKFVEDNLLFLVLSGSRAYGTDRLDSDYDYRGIFMPPLENFLTLKNFGQREDKKNDITIYSVDKFFQLARNVNPNIVELLFVDPSVIVYKHPLMDKILENRHLFLSKKAEYSFSGYAFAQLKKMKDHKAYLDNPLKKPSREAMGLPACPKLSREKIKSLATLGRTELLDIVKSEYVEYVFQEVVYLDLKKEYDRYREWIENRNPVRAALEAKMGFDGKSALHLMRLTRMAREIAIEKTIHTKRPDADFLLDILNGKFTYEELIAMAEKEGAELHELYKQSDLPYSVNVQAIDSLLLAIIKEFHGLSERNNNEKM